MPDPHFGLLGKAAAAGAGVTTGPHPMTFVRRPLPHVTRACYDQRVIPRFARDSNMARGETINHLTLKALALRWARTQGLALAAPEISFPHRRFRVDLAACCPVRKAPSRPPRESVTSILKAAAVFECKQVRADLIRDNRRRELVSNRLRALEARRVRLESLLQLHLPHLANGESLLPEFDCYRLRDFRHLGYQKLVRQIDIARRGLIHGTKFDRLLSYRLANLHYLVVEENVLEPHEVPAGWGLLVRHGEELNLVGKPTWQDITVEVQLIFLQRIAARKTPEEGFRTED